MRINIPTESGTKRVDAYLWPSVPAGLCLAHVPLVDTTRIEWTVTHRESGRRIGPGFTDRDLAEQVAESLAGVTDWTQDDRQLADDATVRDAARRAIERVVEGW